MIETTALIFKASCVKCTLCACPLTRERLAQSCNARSPPRLREKTHWVCEAHQRLGYWTCLRALCVNVRGLLCEDLCR